MAQIVQLERTQTQRSGSHGVGEAQTASGPAIVAPGGVPALTRRRVFHVVAGPLTRERYADFIRDALDAGRAIPTHVQVKHRGAIVCGRISETFERGTKPLDFFRVKTVHFGLVYVPHTQVRMCGGDARCVCEQESHAVAPVSVARRVGVALPPLGNTGVTL